MGTKVPQIAIIYVDLRSFTVTVECAGMGKKKDNINYNVFWFIINNGKRPDTNIAISSPYWIDPCFYSPKQREKLCIMVVLWCYVIYCGVASCIID